MRLAGYAPARRRVQAIESSSHARSGVREERDGGEWGRHERTGLDTIANKQKTRVRTNGVGALRRVRKRDRGRTSPLGCMSG